MTRISLVSIAAVVALVTACTEPDLPRRLIPYEYRLTVDPDTTFHWPTSAMPVRFYAEPVGRLPDYVRDGVRAWQRQFLYGEFRGVLVEDSTQADVIVLLDGDPPADVPPADGPPRLVCEGVTFVPSRVSGTDGVARLAGRLRLHVRWYPGSDPAEAQACLGMVTMHEIGHTLGIFAHSSDPFDLMYPEPQVTWPSLRDQSTIQVLYHVPADILPWDPDAVPLPNAATAIR